QLFFANQLGFQMAGNVMSHLMKLPVEFFLKRHVGDLLSRFGAVHEIRDLLCEELITVVLDGLMAALVLIALLFVNLWLTLVMLAFAAALCVLKLALVGPVRERTGRLLVTEARANSTLMENMRAIEVLKFYCRELPR